jgi:uncharacterized protein
LKYDEEEGISMIENLLDAEERPIIQAFLKRMDPTGEEISSYEKVLGYLSGIVISPGPIMPSEWLKPLFHLNDIVFEDLEEANSLVSAVMALYNRVNLVRMNDENLCPFDPPDAVKSEFKRKQMIDWAVGLHKALTLRPNIWGADDDDSSHVPENLRKEMQFSIPLLWGLADPKVIPEIMPDPVNFQRNLLSKTSGWTEEMLSETWDDELIEMAQFVCLGQLRSITRNLQDYSKAYDKRVFGMGNPIKPVKKKNKIGRNDPCPCGSGKKYKKCCGN